GEINESTGVTVLLVTHDPVFAAYAHRVLRLVDGALARTWPWSTRTATRRAPSRARRLVLRLFRQVSLHQLRSNGARTALLVGGTATGSARIVAIATITRSVLDDFRRTLELIAGPAQLEITLGAGEVGFPEAAVETARADPGVEVALGLVRGSLAVADDPGDT